MQSLSKYMLWELVVSVTPKAEHIVEQIAGPISRYNLRPRSSACRSCFEREPSAVPRCNVIIILGRYLSPLEPSDLVQPLDATWIA